VHVLDILLVVCLSKHEYGINFFTQINTKL